MKRCLIYENKLSGSNGFLCFIGDKPFIKCTKIRERPILCRLLENGVVFHDLHDHLHTKFYNCMITSVLVKKVSKVDDCTEKYIGELVNEQRLVMHCSLLLSDYVY